MPRANALGNNVLQSLLHGHMAVMCILIISVFPPTAVTDKNETGNTITPTIMIIIVLTAAMVLVCIVFCGACICGALLRKYYNRNRKHQAQNTAQDHSPPQAIPTAPFKFSAPCPPITSPPPIALTTLTHTLSPPPPPAFPSFPLPLAFTAFSPLREFFDILPSSGSCIGIEGGCTPSQEKNHYGMCLRIPEGAILEGIKVTIDIGVALYGPFQYPNGLRPVSPVFWICVSGRKNFQFQKNVKITIYHCLSVGNGSESLGLTFLKANHDLSNSEMYELQPVCQAKCDQYFSRPDAGVLSIDHFCCLCICCKDLPRITDQIKYSLICVQPNSDPIIYFYVTYCLQYCIQSVAQKKGLLKGERKFRFANKYLELKYQEEVSGYITHTVACADCHLYEGKGVSKIGMHAHTIVVAY